MPRDVSPADNVREGGEETLWALIVSGLAGLGTILMVLWWSLMRRPR